MTGNTGPHVRYPGVVNRRLRGSGAGRRPQPGPDIFGPARSDPLRGLLDFLVARTMTKWPVDGRGRKPTANVQYSCVTIAHAASCKRTPTR